MIQKELRTLKAFRKLLSDRLLDHTRTGEPDQRFRFCKNNIAQHSKTCGHTARRRICQHGHIELSCIAVFPKCRRRLRHLHQRHDPLLHARAAGTCKDNYRKLLLCRTFYSPGNLFANDPAHACHHKPSVAYSHYCGISVYQHLSRHDCLIQIRTLLQMMDFLLIPSEVQRIDKIHLFIPLFKRALVRDHLDPSVCVYPEISVAFRTNIVSVLHILGNDSRPALITFAQKACRYFRTRIAQGDIVGSAACFLKHIFQIHLRLPPDILTNSCSSAAPFIKPH